MISDSKVLRSYAQFPADGGKACHKKKGGSGSPKTFPIGRDAETGRLTSVKTAQQQPKSHVVERMPKPGRGDTKK